eukprot:2742294-Amphidinium_carterae.1
MQDEDMGVAEHHDDLHGDEAVAADIKMRRTPLEPTRRERELHEANGHIPYRSWCASCVAGRGRADAHHRGRTPTTSTVDLDYAYIEPRAEAEAMGDSAAPIWVARCDMTKATFAEMLPSKGVAHPYNLVALVNILLQLPHNQLTLKSDDEESIKALKHTAAAAAADACETWQGDPRIDCTGLGEQWIG